LKQTLLKWQIFHFHNIMCKVSLVNIPYVKACFYNFMFFKNKKMCFFKNHDCVSLCNAVVWKFLFFGVNDCTWMYVYYCCSNSSCCFYEDCQFFSQFFIWFPYHIVSFYVCVRMNKRGPPVPDVFYTLTSVRNFTFR
jgi:hypothetical protein